MFERLKEHFTEYKVVYCCIGTSVAAAGITFLIMRKRHARIRGVLDGPDMVTMRFPIESNDSRSGRLYDQGRGADVYTTKPQEIIGSQFVSNSTIHGDVINNFKPNRLSYITYDPEANRWWMSQADAARDTGHTEDNISKHILHGKPLSDGLELVRKGIAA